MKVTAEELERCQVLVTVEIDSKKENDILQKAAKRIAKEIKIPGFRPGKAPYNVVVRRFGLEAIQQEALDKSADDMIHKALEEVNITPFARMDLESVEWDPLVIKIKVPTEPKVELNDYRAIRLDSAEVEVSDEDVDERLQQLQENNASWTPIERPAQLNDTITLAVVEKIDDEIVAEHDSLDYELKPVEDEKVADSIEAEAETTEAEAETDEVEEETNEDQADYTPPFRPDLTTPLLGLSAGDEKTFSITYPEDFNDPNYAGKEVTFEVNVAAVKEKALPAIDDELAKTVSDFDTLDELKADIRANIKKQREQQQNNDLGNQVLEQIVAEAEIEWPLTYENESIERDLDNYERQVSRYGLNLDSYLSLENKTREDFMEESRERIVSRLKRSFVIRKIAEQEKLEVGESEILQHAKFLSDLSGQGDRLWRDILSSPIQQELIANDLLVGKVIDWLAAVAKGEAVEPEATVTDDQSENAPVVVDGVSTDAEVDTNEEAVEVESSEATTSNDEAAAPERESSTTERDQDVDQTEEPTPAGVKS
ncbi:MAG: trigger factor [Anaerolineaceae bacterium]|nr:trigger factor [Anaerolineaceae bacterium]MCB9098770.1 trigger factor [Anaerolineales bacterium]